MDRSLDEIVNERQKSAPRGPRHAGQSRRPERNDRNDYPRDGVRKSARDEPRNLDSEWVHDKYETDDRGRRGPPPDRRSRYSPERDYHAEVESSKIRVENIHYELTEKDISDLFNEIGPVERLSMSYDRAGRSNGVAYVTYERARDAATAIREYDGANANGQPIRLILLAGRGGGGGGRGRNPFDGAIRPSRPLADRITRARTLSPAPEGIDRYVPSRGRSRSPLPRRRAEGGRRPGVKRERGERGDAPKGRSAPRPKKTQEELDAEMDDYFGGGNAKAGNEATNASAAEAAVPAGGDIEMAE